mmetsp:Transcript_23652/g.39587  ORF Transcript_23652/g.39587 Transcript_23652/m.39587 type:complete len:272 (+) Transcript_23652:83-898(+)
MSMEDSKRKTASPLPPVAQNAVLQKSDTSLFVTEPVHGYDFNQGFDLSKLLDSYKYIGYQANHFGQAVEEVNRMRSWRLSDEPVAADEDENLRSSESRSAVKCKIFFGYTSNLVSSGLRDIFRFLVQHKMVDVIVTTAGGVEEDIIKCLGPTYLGSFDMSGAMLRSRGLNRIGNLLVPNDNYCKFEDWVVPILDAMLEEQKTSGVVWAPSKVIARLGKEINNESSIYYWAYKNDIPVYCPALTDGSLGDMIYFHSYRNPGLIIDIVSDPFD